LPTPAQLIEKTKQLISQHDLQFIGHAPTINNYGRDKIGEWVILNGKKYYFK